MGILRAGALPGLHMQPTAQVFDGSLRFNGTDHHLSRSFSAGNRRTWTWSAWVKRHKFGATNYGLFSYYPGSGNGGFIRFSDDSGGDTLRFYNDTNNRSIVSSAQFRDPSAWYNIVISVDTTKKQDYERVRRYVNGVRQYDNASNTWPTENEELLFNQSGNHYLGRVQASAYGPVSMSNVNFIDGLALGPDYFGFTDPLTGTWRSQKLRAVGTTVNDGREWSANFSGNGGTQPSTAFDGDGPRQDGYVHSGSALTVNFSPPLSGHIIVYGGTGAGSHNPTTTDTFTLSDGSVLSSQEKYDVAPYFNPLDFGEKKNITSLTCSAGYALYAVEVDGVFLKDSTTENLDFGTNGFYLPMDNEDDFEIDKSGKGNNWTKNGFSGTSVDPDVIKDSPSGAVFGGRGRTGITTTSSAPANYATLNPLVPHSGTLSDGNLSFAGGSAAWCKSVGTFQIPSSGKYYFEGIITGSGAASHGIGLAEDVAGSTESDLTTGDDYYCVVNNTSTTVNKVSNASATSLGSIGAFSQNDVFGVAVDGSTKEIWIHKNNTYFGSNTPSGTALLTGSGNLFPAIWGYNTNGSWDVNFGQKPFKYAPPQGFLPLNSANVRPETVIARPDQYVGVTTYTGTSASTATVTSENIKFQPDFVWCKYRDGTEGHALYDSVRGGETLLRSNTTEADTPGANNLKTFIPGGFTTGNNGHVYYNGYDYVSWMWKAGGNKNTFNVDDVGYASASAAGLDGGDMSPTGASVGTKQGFSILKFTAPSDSGTKTISHGLSQTPEFYIFKETNRSTAWYIFHHSVCDTNEKFLRFDTTNLQSGAGNVWGNLPTSSLISIQNGSLNAVSSQNILYAWHSVPGLQKFGRYQGNGSTDGPFIELGFRPAVIMLKNDTNAGNNWWIIDSERSKYNGQYAALFPNTNGTENTTSAVAVDFLSNGFKCRGADGGQNPGSGNSFVIYAAWAEAPTVNLYGGQSNAR